MSVWDDDIAGPSHDFDDTYRDDMAELFARIAAAEHAGMAQDLFGLAN